MLNAAQAHPAPCSADSVDDARWASTLQAPYVACNSSRAGRHDSARRGFPPSLGPPPRPAAPRRPTHLLPEVPRAAVGAERVPRAARDARVARREAAEANDALQRGRHPRALAALVPP